MNAFNSMKYKNIIDEYLSINYSNFYDKRNIVKMLNVLLVIIALYGIISNISYVYILVLIIIVVLSNRDNNNETYEDEGVKKDNKYLNPDIYELGNDEPILSIDADAEELNNDMEIKTHVDYFMDADSAFEKKNAQRQFHTLTHNKYDDRKKFIDWTCKIDNICKNDGTKCNKIPDDIRGPIE